MASSAPDGFHDPLRGVEHSDRYWSTVNAAEALPGVPTPLNWSWYDTGTEIAMVRTKIAIGATPRGVTPSDVRDERLLGIFSGRAAINVDVWRELADAMPGTSGSSLERDLLGHERPGTPTRARPGRYPVVAVKAPLAFIAARRGIRDHAEDHRRWWRATVAGVAGETEAVARSLFADAFADYESSAQMHLTVSMAAQGLFDALGQLCESAGVPGLDRALTTGLGTTEEGAMLKRLWGLAHDEGDLRDFLADYGYQGPGAGEIATPSWRESPELLEGVIDGYRTLASGQSPTAIEQRQRREREEAEERLRLAVARPLRRPVAGFVRLVQGFMPMRESGRGAILRSLDAARASARLVGHHAHAAARMRDPDDVFMCTLDELVGRARQPSAEELAFRRERFEGYKLLEVPAVWQGMPAVAPIPEAAYEKSVSLDGIGVSDGVVEGRVRVVRDPAVETEFEPGEILVCNTTDPSWSSMFLVAGGVVIDIGGTISHGAIVARELGIPCVINTKDGTRRLRTGDFVRVDGGAGRVETMAVSDEPVHG
jgi:phosphohistidine swiveling domain-containing protein